MAYAKVNGFLLLKFPYTQMNLNDENPYTRYDNRFTLPEWYAQTAEAVESGNNVVEVIVSTEPAYNAATHYLAQKALPELIRPNPSSKS